MRIAVFTLLLLSVAPCATGWAGASPVVNDVTQINPVSVDKIVRPRSPAEVQGLVKSHQGPISIGGGHFSMGGQTASEGTLHLDMRDMDQVLAFDSAAKTITVQSGITWRKIQEHVDPKGLSVKIMQSYANFTVGGSLSVNVHGRYMGLGPLVLSVRSFKIVLPDGLIVDASPSRESEIFYGAIGGYGGLGVIVEATLELADNVKVERQVKTLPLSEYKKYFSNELRNNRKIIFHNADIYPPNYDQATSISWVETDKPVTVRDHLMPVTPAGWKDRMALFGVTELPYGKALRANLLEPLRLRDHPVVWRNYEASYDVSSLEPASRKSSTYVLEEYFVPIEKLEEFANRMAVIFRAHRPNILNVSIRHALKDPGVLLAWARQETFAFVIYYKQGTSTAAKIEVAEWTRELINAAIAEGGTYYLPYQLHATPEQFASAYPNAKKYFELKRKLDPDYRFRNKLWDKYYAPPKKTAVPRPEEQSYLTLPEWYVVFSAEELAAHLARGPPSRFPFFGAIAQFWGLEKDVIRATSSHYPFNFGYHLMISVVGASFTAEYFLRGIYENSVGRLFEWIAGADPLTSQEAYLQTLAADYAHFIRTTPWYEYPFGEKLQGFLKLERPSGVSRFRTWERQLAGGSELACKAAWAWVIRKATAAAYDPDELTIEAKVASIDPLTPLPPQIRVMPSESSLPPVLVLPRYDAFTGLVGELAKKGTKFIEMGGNRRIVLTLIAPRDWKLSASDAEAVAEWPILTDSRNKRFAAAVDISRLDSLLPAWEKQGARLDHLYDY